MIRGTAKFDGIAIGELSANFLAPTVHMEGKAAFVNSDTGTTHGWTKSTRWSEETIKKLQELKESMERDLAKDHFVGESGTRIGASEGTTAANGGGLGEFLSQSDAPQV